MLRKLFASKSKLYIKIIEFFPFVSKGYFDENNNNNIQMRNGLLHGPFKPWAKSSKTELIKDKIYIYSLKLLFSPSKYSPCDAMHNVIVYKAQLKFLEK